MLISLFRIIKFAFQDLRRNWWLTVVTTMVLILTLLSVNGLLILNFMMKSATKSFENKVDVSLYFKSDVAESRVREIRSELNKIPGIVSITLVRPEDALSVFEKRYERDAAVTEALKVLDTNPFGSTLVVKAESPEVYKSVLDAISNPEYQKLIAEHTFDDHSLLIEKIGKFSSRLNQFGIIVSAIFALIALLIAMTTVRVAVYTHRETIGIMKLVGASNWFVRLPYLAEGLLMSIFAVGVALGITYVSLGAIEVRTVGFVSSEPLELAKYFYINFWRLLGAELSSAVLVNLLVMNFAVGRYLKV